VAKHVHPARMKAPSSAMLGNKILGKFIQQTYAQF